jgi:hypothetical protein
MFVLFRLSAVAVLLAALPALVPADDKKKETAENPYYHFWSKSKVGATAHLRETNRLRSPGAGGEPSEDVRLVTHKLLELTPEKAVVETVVTEGEDFGFVESAPTKHIYPAKMSKEVLQELIEETGAKGVKVKLKVKDQELDVMYITGTKKGSKDDDVEFKIWLSEQVPGGIVKRARVTKYKGEVVADTTVELVGFSK